jgi:hypothetical protein
MKSTSLTRAVEAAAILRQIVRLEERLAAAPANSRQRRTLGLAIRTQAEAYRRGLDVEQATATHDEAVRPAVMPALLKRRIHGHARPIPR